MEKRLVLLPLVALGAVMGVSHAQNAAPATPKSDFETEAAKVLDGFNPTAPKAASAPVASKPAPLALPSVSGLPPARPIFQKGAFNLTMDMLEGKSVSESSLLYPVIDENNEIDDDGLPNVNLVSDDKQIWTGKHGYGVRAAQLRVGLNLLTGKPKPKLDPGSGAEIFWLLSPSDWGQMVVDANKTLETNPNDALALAKRAAGWRFAYRLDLKSTTAEAVDAGRPLNGDLMRSDLDALGKLPPTREAMPYVLAALRVNQFAPSAADIKNGDAFKVKAALGNLQKLDAAYAFFMPVAPEATQGRVVLSGQMALAMKVSGDPNAARQSANFEGIVTQVLAQRPKSPLSLWRFAIQNPDADPTVGAKAIADGIGDASATSEVAARIAQLFWSVSGQNARGAAWANLAYAVAGQNPSPLVKWVKAKSLDADTDLRAKPPIRSRLLRESAFGMSLFEADKVEALETLAQDASARGETMIARRALEEAIGAGAPPRFWMLLSSAAEAEANTKTGQEAEDLWVEALNANRIATRYQVLGDTRMRPEIGPDNDLIPDRLTANTDKPGELDPLPVRYAKESPLIAARLHGAWLLLRTERAPSQIAGGWGWLEMETAMSQIGTGAAEKNGKSVNQSTVGAQTAIALHRRFVRAQLERTPDIEETSRSTTVPIKFNRKKVLQNYFDNLIKMSENYAPAK